MYCSVKFSEPMVMVGPPPPPPPDSPVPPTLPQAASRVMARAASSAEMARISLVLFFIFPPFSPTCLTASLLRDLEPLRGERALYAREADLRDDREHGHRERAREQYGGVPPLEPLDDQVPQAAAPDEGRQGGARYDLHRRGADAGEDDRRGYRELDAGEDLAPREPHAARGVDDAGVHLAQGGRGVDEDRGHRQSGEREQRRGEAEAEERQGEGEERQARDGAPDVADVYRRDGAGRRVPYGERDRHGDQDRDDESQRRELHVRKEQLGKAGASDDLEYLADHLGSPPASPRPQVALEGEEQQVGHDREGCSQDGARDDHSREVAVYAVEDQLP